MRYLLICLALAFAGIGIAGCGNGTGPVTNPIPDVARGTFTVSAPPQTSEVAQGATATFAVMATSSGKFTDPVGLAVTGLPTGATATFAPASIMPTADGVRSVLHVATAGGASATPAGTYLLTITGAAAGITQQATVTLVVDQVQVPALGSLNGTIE